MAKRRVKAPPRPQQHEKPRWKGWRGHHAPPCGKASKESVLRAELGKHGDTLRQWRVMVAKDRRYHFEDGSRRPLERHLSRAEILHRDERAKLSRDGERKLGALIPDDRSRAVVATLLRWTGRSGNRAGRRRVRAQECARRRSKRSRF